MHCRFFNRLPLPLLFNGKVLVQSQLHLQHPGSLSKVIGPGGNILFSKCVMFSLLFCLSSAPLHPQLYVEKDYMGLQSSGRNKGVVQTWTTNAVLSTT